MSSEDGDDDTCNVPSTQDPDGMIRIIVANVGEDVSSNDEFLRLVNGGASSSKYAAYSSIDDGINDSNTLRNKVCETPTPVPTPYAVDLMELCDLEDSITNFFVAIHRSRSLSNKYCTLMNEFLLNLGSLLSDEDEADSVSIIECGIDTSNVPLSYNTATGLARQELFDLVMNNFNYCGNGTWYKMVYVVKMMIYVAKISKMNLNFWIFDQLY